VQAILRLGDALHARGEGRAVAAPHARRERGRRQELGRVDVPAARDAVDVLAAHRLRFRILRLALALRELLLALHRCSSFPRERRLLLGEEGAHAGALILGAEEATERLALELVRGAEVETFAAERDTLARGDRERAARG